MLYFFIFLLSKMFLYNKTRVLRLTLNIIINMSSPSITFNLIKTHTQYIVHILNLLTSKYNTEINQWRCTLDVCNNNHTSYAKLHKLFKFIGCLHLKWINYNLLHRSGTPYVLLLFINKRTKPGINLGYFYNNCSNYCISIQANFKSFSKPAVVLVHLSYSNKSVDSKMLILCSQNIKEIIKY